MFFQGRGNGQGAGNLSERDADSITGPALSFCPDTVSIGLTTDSFEHINKCGPVDVPDYRGIKSLGAELSVSFADVQDKMFAVATLGTVTAAGSPGSVSGEIGPTGMIVGSIYYLGGVTPHRAITSLVVTDSATSPGTLVLTTDYTFDPVTGAFTVVDPSGFTQPFLFSYGYTDGASVSLLTAGQKEYFFRFDFINKANANDPGTLELYRVRFDPASLLDFMSDELQIMELKGSVLADTSKLVSDTAFGQFGRRIL